ncbi:MAG: hypothetical protein IJ306_08650, partial [Oscillospiraceae bacterium]|nr:hypothetical protein [Oscillospiraceae bacterium]
KPCQILMCAPRSWLYALLRCPKYSAAFALNILTAASKTSRFIAHWARFDVFAHPSFAFSESHLPLWEGFKALCVLGLRADT